MNAYHAHMVLTVYLAKTLLLVLKAITAQKALNMQISILALKVYILIIQVDKL